MDTLERELQRTLRSVRTDRPVPDDLRESLRRRRRRRTLRTGSAAVLSVVVVVALVLAGGVYLGDVSGPEPAVSPGPTRLIWSDGRVTVDPKRDGSVAADSVIGFVDATHAVIRPYGAESARSIGMQVVDLTTGETTKFLDLPGRVSLAEYGGGVSDHAYVWADRGTIHAVDVRSGKRWVVGHLEPKPQHRGRLTPAEQREAFKPVQFAVGSGYVVWRDYTEGDHEMFASSIRDGRPLRLDGIRDTATLVVDAGRLAAYDGRRVQVFDLATGRLVTERAFARVPATSGVVPATCGVAYCVRGQRAADGARLELMRISDGRSFTVPGAPVITKVVERDSEGRMLEERGPGRPQLVGRWLAFGAGSSPSRETRYLFDIEKAKLRELGHGQLTLTADGHAVYAASLKPGLAEGSSAAEVELRYAELPR